MKTLSEEQRRKRNDDAIAYTKRRIASDPKFAQHVREIKLRSFHRHSDKPKQRYADRKAAGLCTSCGNDAVAGKGGCEKCLSVRAERQRKQNRKICKAIFDHYGWTCSCPHCPESNPKFLTLDHINNDGKRETNSGGDWRRRLYRKAKSTGKWPDDLRTMCYNCNLGRARNGGVCPHEEEARFELRPAA